MRASYGLRWLIACVALAIGSRWALGDDVNYGQPLTQVSFDRLVPTSYPTSHPNFDRLQPTKYPLIDPGVPQIHITEGLTQAFDKPLLITNESGGTGFTTSYGRVPLPGPSPSPVRPRPVIPVTTHPSPPVSAPVPKLKPNSKKPSNQKSSSSRNPIARLS